MKTTWQKMREWIAAVVTLSWAALGLSWAQVILLPTPLLPPRSFADLLGDIPATTRPERFIVMVLKETSLLLCAFALLGIVLAALTYLVGARRSALIAAVLCAATVGVSLVPASQAWRIASAEGAPLSPSGYLAGFFSAADRSPETVTYSHPGGEALELDVWQSPGEGSSDGAAKERPAIIVVHGGGWRSGNRGDFPLWNAWLAGRGYVVFDIDYRLSPPPSWQDAPADVRCAVAWVKENAARYDVDPGRVALMGRSAGGHLALLVSYAEDTSSPLPTGCDVRKARDSGVAAVAAFYPPTDLARLDRLGYLAGMDRFMGGASSAFPGRYRLDSPVVRVDPTDPPTFLVHGGDDEIVPPGQSGLLAERLRGTGVPHHYLELPWANHTFDFFWGGWGAQITRSTLGKFLENHLETPDGPDAASKNGKNQ